MTRVVDAWDEGYEAGRDGVFGYSTTREARTPNPYQRSDVDADHAIAASPTTPDSFRVLAIGSRLAAILAAPLITGGHPHDL